MKKDKLTIGFLIRCFITYTLYFICCFILIGIVLHIVTLFSSSLKERDVGLSWPLVWKCLLASMWSGFMMTIFRICEYYGFFDSEVKRLEKEKAEKERKKAEKRRLKEEKRKARQEK